MRRSWNSREAGLYVPVIGEARYIPRRLWADDARQDALDSIPRVERMPLWCELVRGAINADYLRWALHRQVGEDFLCAHGMMPRGARTFAVTPRNSRTPDAEAPDA